uniref:C2H2-type domain-containing protein n=1 Tax=Timspurckia oligopyrenoides TaxID=708627 RepID=A0A7S0ZFK2_9RHOD|mmetsp:Transcript_3334/g.5840  ORF Transcript_3334/g.5840 Transcript_3334/m.5840 type:complete len:581 (+) Transcript_3334:38-1780(+)
MEIPSVNVNYFQSVLQDEVARENLSDSPEFDALGVIQNVLMDDSAREWLLKREAHKEINPDDLDRAIDFSFGQNTAERLHDGSLADAQAFGLMIPHFISNTYVLMSSYSPSWPHGVFWPVLTKFRHKACSRPTSSRGVMSINRFPVEFMEFAWFPDDTLLVSVGFVSCLSRLEIKSFWFQATEDDGSMPTKIIEYQEGVQHIRCKDCEAHNIAVCKCWRDQRSQLEKSDIYFNGWDDWIRYFGFTQNGESLYNMKVKEVETEEENQLQLFFQHSCVVSGNISNTKRQYLDNIRLNSALPFELKISDFILQKMEDQIMGSLKRTNNAWDDGSFDDEGRRKIAARRPPSELPRARILSAEESDAAAVNALATAFALRESFSKYQEENARKGPQIVLLDDMTAEEDNESSEDEVDSLIRMPDAKLSHDLTNFYSEALSTSDPTSTGTESGASLNLNESLEKHRARKGKEFRDIRSNIEEPENLSATQRRLVSNNSSSSSLSCETCGRVFASTSNLGRHRRSVHGGQKNWICEVCGLGFSVRGNLERHVGSIHSNIRPHACELCPSRFSQKYDLQRHINLVHSS